MSKLFKDIMRGFSEFAEVTEREVELFPKIIKTVCDSSDLSECQCTDERICIISSKDVTRTVENLVEVFYEEDACAKENVVCDCRLRKCDKINCLDCFCGKQCCNATDASEKGQPNTIGRQEYDRLLREYIQNFHPKVISESKNLWLDITEKGEFVATKRVDDRSIECDLSAFERALFNFLCFVEKDNFCQFVHGENKCDYKKKPLIVINFLEFLDEKFDYIGFIKGQNLNRVIIVVKGDIAANYKS